MSYRDSDSSSYSDNKEEKALDSSDSSNNDSNCTRRTRKTQRPVVEQTESINKYIENVKNDKRKSKASPSWNVDTYESNNRNIKVWLIVIALLAITALLYYVYFYLPTTGCSVQKLKPKFKKQTKDLWANVGSSLDDSFINVKTLVLLYDEESRDTATCLAKEIASTFACGSSHTFLTPGKINDFESFGKFLEGNRETFGKAVVFKDLTSIDFEKVQIFQTICDAQTPYIKPALYVFTLAAPNSSEVPQFLARKILEKKWSHLNDHILDPLINRILGLVTFVRKEDQLPCQLSAVD